jgi:outer membrane protein OmpA-like peptidoglycan-associated protein
MKPNFTHLTTGLGLVALVASGSASAADSTQISRKEETIGVFSGMAIGAIAGGPFGAIAGMTLGSWLGHRFDAKKEQLATLDERLKESDQTVAQLAAELSSSQERVAALSEDLRTQPLPPAVRKTLRGDVLFRTNDSTLTGDIEAQITQLAQALAGVPDVVVKVDGYADPRGTPGENLKLSGARAQAVRAALVAGGIADNRIMVEAHGEDGVTTPPGDVDGYALDRRVVITLEGADQQVAQSADADAASPTP